MRLQGKVAVITGGAGGLGREIARRFAAEGARVVVIADLDGTAAARTAEELSTPTTEVVARPLDVRDPAQVDALVAETAGAHGSVDVMVNNVGVVAPVKRLHAVSVEDFRRVVDVNLTGTFNGISAAVRVMRDTGGSIINTSSVAGLTAWSHSSAYGAAKAAVIQLTRIAAVEYAPRIRVNCVCPGTMNTAMNDAIPRQAMDGIVTDYPMGRLAEPEEVAPAYVYLASDESAWTTGSVVTVDGGYTAR